MERTQILRQDTMHNQNYGKRRPGLSSCYIAHRISSRHLSRSADSDDLRDCPQELQSQLRTSNPTLMVDAAAVDKQKAQLASAKRNSKPDFTLGYDFQFYRRRLPKSLFVLRKSASS